MPSKQTQPREQAQLTLVVAVGSASSNSTGGSSTPHFRPTASPLNSCDWTTNLTSAFVLHMGQPSCSLGSLRLHHSARQFVWKGCPQVVNTVMFADKGSIQIQHVGTNNFSGAGGGNAGPEADDMEGQQ